MNHDPKERLRSLLGDRLANQLVIDILKANSDLQKVLLSSILKAHDDRVALTSDELAERKYDNVRVEALACVKQLMMSAALCSTVNAGCVIARGQGHPMAAFVAHVASHYEDELAAPRGAADLTAELRTHNELPSDDVIEHMAKAHSSNN